MELSGCQLNKMIRQFLVDKLSFEDLLVTDDNFIEDISCIVYCNDVFECE